MSNTVCREAAPVGTGCRERSARGALAGLSFSVLMASLGLSVVPVGLPAMAVAFRATFAEVQWIVLAYLLVVTAVIVGGGRLGDLLGRRRVLLWGLVLFMGASGLGGMAPDLGAVIGARALQGLGGAALMALGMALVGEAVPGARAGRAMGLLGTMSAIGTALGPSLGGVLLAAWGWRALFLMQLPLGGIAFWFASRHLPEDRPGARRQPGGFDGVGMFVLAVSLVAFALAMTPGRARFGVWNGTLLAVAAVAGVVFWKVEARAKAPLIRVPMSGGPRLVSGLVMSALVSAVLMSTLVAGPFHLSRGLGLDAAAVGFALAVGPMAAALAGVPAGRLTDRVGPSRVILGGLGTMAVGSTALAVLPESLGVAGYLGPLAVMTTGYGLFQTANNTAVMGGVPSEQRGAHSGLLNLSRQFGLIVGATVLGLIFSWGTATPDPATAAPDAVAIGLRTTFAVATGLIVVALAIAWFPGRRPARLPRGGVRS